MEKTVLEIPEELKGMVPALRGMLDAVMTQVERGRRGGPAIGVNRRVQGAGTEGFEVASGATSPFAI